MFDADRPITKSTQDRLNRSVFAKYLARCMLDHKDAESLVVGLYGGWGAGKTSIINLAIEELNLAASNMFDHEKPIILNFSPWSYSGQNQLIYSFFRRFSSTLRSVTYLEHADRIIYLLELYVSYFTQKPIPKSLRQKRSLLDKLLFRKPNDIYAWESGRDLTAIKAELNALLKNQSHKIIIIIDNISRLHDNEIMQIFQIVKSIGDYANTSYLLALDKDQVIRSLNKNEGVDTEKLIEKIVQLPFEIPLISQQDLENIFVGKLNEVVVKIPENEWSVEYWADIYYCSLKFLFKNCRDITRYINTLNFSYQRLQGSVNPIDFFALTAIEVFAPEVYFGIRNNKDLFSDLIDHVYILDSDQAKKDKLRCEEIISHKGDVPRDLLLELLMRLFPRIHHLYQPNAPVYHSLSAARQLKRICCPDLFDIYFRLSIQSSHLSETEFETVLSFASDEVAFDHALTRINQDARILYFLDQLDSKRILRMPRESAKSIITALLDNGDLFPAGTPSPLCLDTPMRIHRIIHTLLNRFEKTEDRFLIMQHAISNASKSIYIITHELEEQGKEHTENEYTFKPDEFRDLSTEQLYLLRKLATTRIQFWAEGERLVDHPKLMPLLFAWRNWGNQEACFRFVQQMTATDKGLIAFLIAFLDHAINEVINDYEKNPLGENYLANIEVFIPIEKIESHAIDLFEDGYFEKLREKEQLALMIFLDLIQANTTKIIPKTTV